LADPNGSYDIDDVSRGSARNAFKPFPRGLFRNRVIKGWFRFAMRIPADDDGKFTIGADNGCDVFDFYYRRANGTYALVRDGMLVPYAELGRLVPGPNISVTHEMASGQPIYVHIVANRWGFGAGNGLFGSAPTKLFEESYRRQQLRDIFFGGLFFTVLVTNLFLGFYLRDRTFFAYCVAMALHVLTQFTQDGSAWQFFWPHPLRAVRDPQRSFRRPVLREPGGVLAHLSRSSAALSDNRPDTAGARRNQRAAHHPHLGFATTGVD
jgi:hypothetical protein